MARGFQGMPGGNMQALARQAQKMQQKMMEMQAELEAREYEASAGGGVVTAKVNGKKELLALEKKLQKQMNTAAAELNFELAAKVRDQLFELKKKMLE